MGSPQKPARMIAMCCCRTVGKMTSGERGQAVTVICGINAAGQYIPLICPFARKKVIYFDECCSSTINGLRH